MDRALTKMEKELVNGLRQAAARIVVVLARRLGSDIAPLGRDYWLKCAEFVVLRLELRKAILQRLGHRFLPKATLFGMLAIAFPTN